MRRGEASSESGCGGGCVARWAAQTWLAYERAAGRWERIPLTTEGGPLVRSGRLWVVDATDEPYAPRRDRLGVILHELVPIHVTAAGDRLRGHFCASEPQRVAGGRLRLVLLVDPSGEGHTTTDDTDRRSTAPFDASASLLVGPIEVPFDDRGDAVIDVPLASLGRHGTVSVTERQWPAHLRRLWVVVPASGAAPLGRS